MQSSNSYNAGYRLGQFVRPLVSGMRDVLASRTERQVPQNVDYDALAATPTMVRRGVDLSAWQARNLSLIDEPTSADEAPQVFLLGWDGFADASSDYQGPAPSPSFPRALGPRSSLDALI
ncbi:MULTISPECIES: hypothetical protein [Stutzerimonas]|jgi:hypothetical protein|uniref:hypothetical protein n=1 Tax=Stutzerimonas TaxID=2901164 RepID=UPI000F773F5C|nr:MULTISPECIES: hypothetical protein [Stutzerimonas]MCW8158257.1 hypothetical protein [Stutzerimonas stutzeri]MDH0214522.1 hypothetical protein [Stutzerimonas stutzeri]MDH0261857.1 hypothetical protein [Stutzerimonas stutzeri]MDI9729140.1 hypothetical protein [Stutzerimonas stutzeri]MDI9750328.1 hypothetical protein [Stutzerimonas stutzeri]